MTGLLTINALSSLVSGQAFEVSGAFGVTPSFTYADDGGAFQSLPPGSSTPALVMNSWSFQHPGDFAVSGTHTVKIAETLTGVSGLVAIVVKSAPGSVTTWNPKDLAGGITLSNNNGTATATGNKTAYSTPQGVRATTPIPVSGLVAYEIAIGTPTQNTGVGVADAAYGLASANLGGDTHAIGFYFSTGPGSQLPQSVWFNGTQFMVGSVSSPSGDIASIIVNGGQFWVSTGTMRSVSGAIWNDSKTADPATGVGGFSFAGIGTPRFPIYATNEGGSSAVINGGATAFSAFLTAYIKAHPTVAPIDGLGVLPPPGAAPGQVLPAVSGVVISVQLTWAAVGGETPITYTVLFRIDGTTSWTTAGSTALTNFTVGGLQPATKYDFAVFATNAAGTTQGSNLHVATVET